MTDTGHTPTRLSVLTEGSISRELLRFGVPILWVQIISSINTSVNSIWVGRFLGEAALTAVSNAHALLVLLTGIVLGITSAATILIGQHAGAGKITEAKRVVGTSLTLLGFISIGLAFAGWAAAEPLLALMKAPPDSLPLAVTYIKALFMVLPGLYLYASVASILRGIGDSLTPFYFALLSVALDIALNPLFIFGLGPIPSLGILGPALAMFFSQTISLVALVLHLYRRHHPLCLDRGELTLLRLDTSVLRWLVLTGLSFGVETLVFTASAVLMIMLVNRLDVGTTAAFAVLLQIWAYIQMPSNSISMAVATMVAMNAGGQRWDRARAAARMGVVYSALFTSAMAVLVCLADTRLYGLFLPRGSSAVAIVSHANMVVSWSFVLSGVSAVLFGVTRATGAVIVPVVVSILTLIVVRFPVAFILLDHWRADAIWWSFVLSSASNLLLAALYYNWHWKRLVLKPSLAMDGKHTYSSMES